MIIYNRALEIVSKIRERRIYQVCIHTLIHKGTDGGHGNFGIAVVKKVRLEKKIYTRDILYPYSFSIFFFLFSRTLKLDSTQNQNE